MTVPSSLTVQRSIHGNPHTQGSTDQPKHLHFFSIKVQQIEVLTREAPSLHHLISTAKRLTLVNHKTERQRRGVNK
jgi:hypothetical protein